MDSDEGTPCGAGVLLDERHVLTCAHVVRHAHAEPGGRARGLRISSVACDPEWQRTARVAPGTWVHTGDTRRGDVALLELDEPADCGTATALWRAPISGGKVRVYGFPQAEPYGIWTDAELSGSGGRQGEWGQLSRVRTGSPWIEPGYSGAGVQAVGGEFGGRIIGIVVRDYVDDDAKAAWMLPTETVVSYLPRIERLSGGGRANQLGPAAAEHLGGAADDVLGDALRLALTQELTRLLTGPWSGTVVVRTGGTTGTGTSWLVRLVRTADPAARATLSDAELAAAPGDTVLGLGAIDAAYDARGRTLADVCDYLAHRFAMPAADGAGGLVHRLLRLKPPVCLVVGGVDQAAEREALVTELLAPLAARARSRGIRLVLGVEGPPPAGLPHEALLDPEPLTDAAAPGVTAAAADDAVRRLAEAEEAATRLQTRWGLKLFAAPHLPPAVAPRLRVRLAAGRDGVQGAGPPAEPAAIHARAVAARAEVARYDRAVRHQVADVEDLRQSLELHRMRAARYFGAEDRALGDLHTPAARALWTVPIDVAGARELVRHYTDEVNRRIGGIEGTGEGGGPGGDGGPRGRDGIDGAGGMGGLDGLGGR